MTMNPTSRGMTLDQMIDREKTAHNAKVYRYNEMIVERDKLAGKHRMTEDEQVRHDKLRDEAAALRAEVERSADHIIMLERELEDDNRIVEAQSQIIDIGFTATGGGDGYTVGGDGARRAAGGSAGPRLVRLNDLKPATVARGQRFADHAVVREDLTRNQGRDAAVIGQHGDLGQLVRSLTTTGGSALVPSVWAADVIDRARNLSAVMQAGAELVPMDAKTVQVGRLTGDPTAAFRGEGTAITASDPTFDNVTLTAKSLNALVIGSMEWFMDAADAEALVTNAIAQAIALQLDKVALYGGTNTGGVDLTAATNPTGVVANLTASAATSILGNATNGTTQTATSFYGELIDAAYTPRDYNETPNAAIWNSKAARLYAKATDSTNQPLRRPADLDALQWFISNQVPSYTQGTMANVATDVFVGDFSQLLIGQRLDLTIQVLTERYADLGQIGIVATWRGDIGIARPRAFSVYKAIKGA